MPLILKAAGQRIYLRGGEGQAQTQLYGVRDWSYIKDRANAANTFICTFAQPCLEDGTRYIPGIRDEVFIYKSEADYDNDLRWFGGLITKPADNIAHKDNAGYLAVYRIESQAFDIILNKELRQPQKAGLNWGDLIKYLMGIHFSSQLSTDYSHISNPIPAPAIRINNGTMATLLAAMRQLTGYDYFVDAYKKLHVFRSQDVPGSFRIEDVPDSGITVWDERPVITREGRDIYNIVRQPFFSQVDIDDWSGETFTAKGDPKGGGQLPLGRTPTNTDETTYLQEKFDGNVFDNSVWIESDTITTENEDYPNQGYMFPANGQCQVLGGTGSLGGVALQSQDFFGLVESAYLVQEFQLTNATGDGYICLFTDGEGLATGNFKAGLRVEDNVLKALDGTVLLSGMGTVANYLLWVMQTADGWQYDIQGGTYATKQTIRIETGVTHLTDYKIAPIVNKSLQCSINSVRFRNSDRGLTLEIDGIKKVVGLESSDTDLPDIDAFLNVDETPALLKFRAASDISLIASVASATEFTAVTGHGPKFKVGHRLLVGDDIVEEFNGKEGFVASVAGDVVTLVSPGITGMATGKQILINSTVPAKDAKLVVKYAYSKSDEASAIAPASIDAYGPFPITLPEKDYIKYFDDAQLEAENYLKRYEDGILVFEFNSNSALLPIEPEPMTSIPVVMSRRPDPINRNLILQRVEITPRGHRAFNYALRLESADPVKPIEDLLRKRALIIGSEGEIRFSLSITDRIVNTDELTIREVASPYILWANPEGRKYGEFRWQP